MEKIQKRIKQHQIKAKQQNNMKRKQQQCMQFCILIRSQTISKLKKKNEEQRQQFIVLNQKLNKAFTKLSASKLRQPQKSQTQPQNSQLQKIKKQLENEIKKNKNLKKQLQIIRQTQNLLNNQDKFNQLKNEIINKNRQIKLLEDKLRGYEKAEENQKKMNHYKKQQQLNKKLHQLNEENIFLKKKQLQMKNKIQQIQKQKTMQKVQQAVQKNLKNISPRKPQNDLIKKQVHQQQIKKIQNQLRIYQNIKSSMQKTHKQQIQALKKQNHILHQQIEQLKYQIKRKNKQKIFIQNIKRSSNIRSQMKTSRIQRNSLTIQLGQNDKNNCKLRTISPLSKTDNDIFGSLRKQFLGLSYGNYSNQYKKQDDSLVLDESRSYTISSVTFTFFQQHILSLKTKYKYTDGAQKTLTTFDLQNSYSNFKTSQLILHQHEYIKQMDIYGRKMIQLIQIRTSRNQFFQIGNQKNQVKCKKYSFNIKSHQKPIAFGSVSQYKKINDNKIQCLVALGLILKKKDILISKKKGDQNKTHHGKQKNNLQKSKQINQSTQKNKSSLKLSENTIKQKKK